MHLNITDISKSINEIIMLMLKGEEIIVTKNNKPIAKLVTLDKQEVTTLKIEAGSAKGKIKVFDNFDEPIDDFKEYMP